MLSFSLEECQKEVDDIFASLIDTIPASLQPMFSSIVGELATEIALGNDVDKFDTQVYYAMADRLGVKRQEKYDCEEIEELVNQFFQEFDVYKSHWDRRINEFR